MERKKQGRLIFITGGARSGKSSFAVKFAKTFDRSVAFMATCVPEDNEMTERVRRHKKERPRRWLTVEGGDTPFEINCKRIPKGTQVLLVDCITLWTATLVLRGQSLSQVRRKLLHFLKQAFAKFSIVILVSNEVGCGIVPESKLSRTFRDVLGKVNQETAKCAQSVFFIVSGVPVQIKGRSSS